jgi:hypothetical protein
MSNTSTAVIDTRDWRKSPAFAQMPPATAYSARYTFEEYVKEVETKACKTSLQAKKTAAKAEAATKASNTFSYLAMTESAKDNAYATLIASPLLDKPTADKLMKEKEIAVYVARNANIAAAKARAIAASTAEAAALATAKDEVAQKDVLEINHVLNLHMELMGY